MLQLLSGRAGKRRPDRGRAARSGIQPGMIRAHRALPTRSELRHLPREDNVGHSIYPHAFIGVPHA